MNELSFYVNGALECRQEREVHVKQVKLKAENIKAAVDEEGNESCFNEIEKGNYDDLPFHFLESVLMPPNCHKLLDYRNKDHLEEGNHDGQHEEHYKVDSIIR